ncbi:hypothetical protein HELRODRAFT_194896 [Helobdella robusta]|uniref:UBA domain-containing protein n=1 Tax=Helobdella robusta TaxID=6412 RepID=T1FWJ3_HELRO|nr:hypothetical protein HELRODRAFT_194896 [Helobdella robusta]ESO11115.1 hypothetical protein HELRODRAFT_194896 [Helobdella robusta]
MEDRLMDVSVVFFTAPTHPLHDVRVYRPKLMLYRVRRDISLESLRERLQSAVDKCIVSLVYVKGGHCHTVTSDAVLLKAIKGCGKELRLYLLVDPETQSNDNPTETNACTCPRSMNNQNSEEEDMDNSSLDCSGSTSSRLDYLEADWADDDCHKCSVCERKITYFRYVCCTCLEHFCYDCLPKTPHFMNNHLILFMKGIVKKTSPVSPHIFSLLDWVSSGYQDSVSAHDCETAAGNEATPGDKTLNAGVSCEKKKNTNASLEVDDGSRGMMIEKSETLESDLESVASDKDNYDCLDDFVIVPMPDCFDVNLPASRDCSRVLYISRDDVSTTNNGGYVVENIIEFVGSQQEEIDVQQQQIDSQQQQIDSERQIGTQKEQIEVQQPEVDLHQHQQSEVQQAQQQQHLAQQNQQNKTTEHSRDSDDDISEHFEECLQHEYEHYHLNQQNEPKIREIPEPQQQQKCFIEAEIQHQLFNYIEPPPLDELEQLYQEHSIGLQQLQPDGEDVTCDSEIAFLRQIDEIEYHENQTKQSIPQASINNVDPFSLNGDGEEEASPLQLVADVVNTAGKMASKAANKAFDAMKQAYRSLQIQPSSPGPSRSPSCFGHSNDSNNFNYSNTNYNNNNNNSNNNNGCHNNDRSVNGKAYCGNNLGRGDSSAYNVGGVNFSNVNVNNNTTSFGSSSATDRAWTPKPTDWTPKPTGWTPKPTDWTPKKADWVPPEENWVPKLAAYSSAPTSSSRDLNAMNLLVEMGFANRRVNNRLVKMFNGDMDLILNDITSNGYIDRTCPGVWDLD